jgi:hypothetical protein
MTEFFNAAERKPCPAAFLPRQQHRSLRRALPGSQFLGFIEPHGTMTPTRYDSTMATAFPSDYYRDFARLIWISFERDLE